MKEEFNTKKLVQTALMLALALVFQIGFASFAQLAVGPLVNMVLFITVMLVSPLSAILIGVLTPLIAFMLGIINLFPLVPAIAIGNILLIGVYSFFYYKMKSNYKNYIGITIAAFVKFSFLAMAVRIIIPVFVAKVPQVLVTALSLNQFFTAIIGGMLALLIFKAIHLVVYQKKL